MSSPKRTFQLFFLLILVGLGGWITVRYYSYIFAKNISGEIFKVERVTQTDAVVATGMAIPTSQLYSFAVAIKDAKGEIHTASTEDRQWAVAQAGKCVDAKFFPYAPWDLAKAGTYFGARLLRLYECPPKP